MTRGTLISGYVSTSASWYLYPRPHVLMPLPTAGNVYFSTEAFRALYPYPGPESSFAQQPAGMGGSYGIVVNANAGMGDGENQTQFGLNSAPVGVSNDSSRFELSVAAVPEPNVIALLGLGAGAVIARLRRKRNG